MENTFRQFYRFFAQSFLQFFLQFFFVGTFTIFPHKLNAFLRIVCLRAPVKLSWTIIENIANMKNIYKQHGR